LIDAGSGFLLLELQTRQLADNLSKAGWSWGCISAVDSNGHTIWIADAHRDDGNRFVRRGNEKLTAFLELERVCSLLRVLLSEAQEIDCRMQFNSS
jgi:hypothetical protein